MILKIKNKIKNLKNFVITCFVRIYFTPSNIQLCINWSTRLLFSTTRKRFFSKKQIEILVPRPYSSLDRSDPYLKKFQFEYFYQFRYYLEYIEDFDIINKLCLNFKTKNLLNQNLKYKDLYTFDNVHSILESKSKAKELCDYRILILNNQIENQKLILMFNTNIIFLNIKNPIDLKNYNFDNSLSYYPVVDRMNLSESEKEIDSNYESDDFPITINNLETSCYMIGIKQDKYVKSCFKKTNVSINDQQVYFIIKVPTGSSNLNYIYQYCNIFLSIIDFEKIHIPSFD